MGMSFQSPNYTMAPNDLFDDLLKEIDDLSELKVTLAAVRHTFGHHRSEAEMGHVWFEKVTGLSRASVKRGITLAVQRGTIRVVKEHTATTPTIYAVNVEDGVRGLAASPASEGEGVETSPIKESLNNNNNPSPSETLPELQERWYKELEKLTGGYMGGAEELKDLTAAWQKDPDPRRHDEAKRQTENAHSRTVKVYLRAYVTFNPDWKPPTPKTWGEGTRPALSPRYSRPPPVSTLKVRTD